MPRDETHRPLIVDGHQDIAWSTLTFGRNYLRAAAETRQLERGTEIPAWQGDTLLGWPDYQQGRIAVIFVSLFASPLRHQCAAWDTLCYRDISQAKSLYQAQVDLYWRLADDHPDAFRLIMASQDLSALLAAWEAPSPEEGYPVGLVIAMEGAEAVESPLALEAWWEQGVRVIGPAWAANRYCGSANEPGPLTREGFLLLETMAEIGFGLDLSHMAEEAALMALDYFPGTILATHSNAAALVKAPDERFLSDRVIRRLIEREGVVGIVPANRFLRSDWEYLGGRQTVRLERVVAQIDHICQLAGDAGRVGLGSDYDGGFGLQSVPGEIDSIADLQKLVPLLSERGYTGSDIEAIMGGNWLDKLKGILP